MEVVHLIQTKDVEKMEKKTAMGTALGQMISAKTLEMEYRIGKITRALPMEGTVREFLKSRVQKDIQKEI